jgi:hypothetical protein
VCDGRYAAAMRVLLLGFLAGCFRAPEGAAAEPGELRVSDLAGVPVALDEAPRDLELSFVGPLDAEPRLMRGHMEDVLLAQLSFARPSAALAAQLLEVAVEPTPAGQRVRALSLAPGRYTLVWSSSEPHAFPFSVSSSPALGARWAESAPGDGATRVPSNLAQGLVRFDGHVQGSLATAIQLPGFDVRVDRCAPHGFPEGDCAWLTPHAPLRAGRHELMLEAGLYTPGGAEVPAQRIVFDVVASPDHTAPSLMATRCAVDERALAGACVRTDEAQLFVHARTDEPCFVALTVGTRSALALSYAGEVALALRPQQAQGTATLKLTDLAGNVRESPVAFELLALAQVALEELRHDPLGAEPAQEYAELLNFGAEPVSLMGFSLSTDATSPGRTLGAGELAPGERALVVGPAFDPRDTSDGVLPGGLKLVMASGALSLANAGGQVFLRDAQGRRLASARTLAPLVEGQCTRRLGPALREGTWELDARGGCTPGSE